MTKKSRIEVPIFARAVPTEEQEVMLQERLREAKLYGDVSFIVDDSGNHRMVYRSHAKDMASTAAVEEFILNELGHYAKMNVVVRSDGARAVGKLTRANERTRANGWRANAPDPTVQGAIDGKLKNLINHPTDNTR